MRQPLDQIHPLDSRQRIQAFLQQVHSDCARGRQPKSFRGELEYFCVDGSTIWADVLVIPVLNADGSLQTRSATTDLGGTMRLGSYPAVLGADTVVSALYGATTIEERHRHRFEVNNAYREQLAAAGMRWSGTSPDGRLVEFLELPEHPFFVATQAHPELRSRPNRPHPLFAGLVSAAVRHRREAIGRLPVDLDGPAGELAPARAIGFADAPHA
jgi:hypothetical protein